MPQSVRRHPLLQIDIWLYKSASCLKAGAFLGGGSDEREVLFSFLKNIFVILKRKNPRARTYDLESAYPPGSYTMYYYTVL
jgi:hypothetical protein